MPIVLEATNCLVSPPPSVVIGAAVVFLLHVMALPQEVLEPLASPTARECLTSLQQQLSQSLGPGLSELYDRSINGSLPLEVSILITCLVSEMFEVAIESACQTWADTVQQGGSALTWPVPALHTLTRVNASLEALCHSRGASKQRAKQPLLAALSASHVPDQLSAALASLLQHASANNGSGSGGSSASMLLSTASSLVSLSHSLLQCLGKKEFFGQASTVLVLCHDFLNVQLEAGGGGHVFQGAGLDWVHQVLRLTQGVASASSSAIGTLGEQTAITLRLLMGISGALNDKAVCAELLDEVWCVTAGGSAHRI